MQINTPRTEEKRRTNWPQRLWMGAVVSMMAGYMMWQGITGLPAAEVQEQSIRQGRVVMYMMDSAEPGLTDLRADMVDQLNFSFALIDNGLASGSHWQGIRQVSAWLKKHPQVDGVLSVGGWGADGFSQACANDKERERLAQSMLTLMDEHGFVGLDIDWEYPGSSAAGIAASPEDVENWYSLLSALRLGLDERTQATGKQHILSVALGAGKEQLVNLDGARLSELVDQVMLMTYDMTEFSKTTAHHAGLYAQENQGNSADQAVQTLLKSGFPGEKLLLGIPAYGRMWRQVGGGGRGLHQQAATSGNKTLTFDQLMQLETLGYTAYFDDTAQAAWFFDGTNFVSGENEQSILAKAAYLQEKGLLGAGVWCWNHDPDDTLLGMLHKGLTPDG